MTMIPFKFSTLLALAMVALQVFTMPEVVDAYTCVSRRNQTRLTPHTAIYTYMQTRPLRYNFSDSFRFVGLRVRGTL